MAPCVSSIIFKIACSYHFLEVDKDQIRLGFITNGVQEIQEKFSLMKPIEMGEFRVVGSKTHFRGYFNGDLVVHGHGSEPETGSLGLAIQGKGTLKLSRMQMQVLP